MNRYVQRAFDALERGRRFVTHDVWQIGRPGEAIPHGFIIKQVRVVILLLQGLLKDALLLRASALTFATALCIIPLLAIMFYVIQTFDLGEGFYTFLSEKLRVSASQTAQAPLEGQKTSSSIPVAAETQNAPLDKNEKNRRLLKDLIDWAIQGVGQPQDVQADAGQQNPVKVLIRYAEEGASSRTIGIAGFIFVLATVFGLMCNIEGSFNSIWGLSRRRSWYRMFTDYMVIVLLLPFLMAGVVALIAVLRSDTLTRSLGPFAFVLGTLQYGIPVLVFASLYYVVPNTRVKVRFALIGGIVAGVLWTLLSRAYVSYQFGLPDYNLFYGALAQFPLLLMWVYLSWTIVLFGAELSFAYQNEKTFAMERLAAGASHAYREALGLRAMIELGQRFDKGMAGLVVTNAAESWRVPTRLLNETLDQLEAAALVARCATEPPTYQPSRSLDKITVNDVLRAIREAGRDPSVLRADAVYREVLTRLQNSEPGLLGTTIGALVGEMRAAGGEEPANGPPHSPVDIQPES